MIRPQKMQLLLFWLTLLTVSLTVATFSSYATSLDTFSACLSFWVQKELKYCGWDRRGKYWLTLYQKVDSLPGQMEHIHFTFKIHTGALLFHKWWRLLYRPFDITHTQDTALRLTNYFHPFSETIIYRVTPSMSSPTLLATPNWPQGMRPSSTVSWIVTVPSQHQAHLQFVNVSQPKCNDRHTSIKVKMLGYEEEIMSRREDEPAEEKLLVPKSFYLNMSNCIPEEGQFGAVTKIVLQKKTSKKALL